MSRRTDYLVIGSIGAEDWRQAGFCDMLDAVVRYRSQSVPIAVVSEDQWVDALV